MFAGSYIRSWMGAAECAGTVVSDGRLSLKRQLLIVKETAKAASNGRPLYCRWECCFDIRAAEVHISAARLEAVGELYCSPLWIA
jgi:hypothetical protein